MLPESIYNFYFPFFLSSFFPSLLVPSFSSGSLRNDGIKAADVLTVLREKVAFVSGGKCLIAL